MTLSTGRKLIADYILDFPLSRSNAKLILKHLRSYMRLYAKRYPLGKPLSFRTRYRIVRKCTL
jgi:hypothetical protein